MLNIAFEGLNPFCRTKHKKVEILSSSFKCGRIKDKNILNKKSPLKGTEIYSRGTTRVGNKAHIARSDNLFALTRRIVGT